MLVAKQIIFKNRVEKLSINEIVEMYFDSYKKINYNNDSFVGNLVIIIIVKKLIEYIMSEKMNFKEYDFQKLIFKINSRINYDYYNKSYYININHYFSNIWELHDYYKFIDFYNSIIIKYNIKKINNSFLYNLQKIIYTLYYIDQIIINEVSIHEQS